MLLFVALLFSFFKLDLGFPKKVWEVEAPWTFTFDKMLLRVLQQGWTAVKPSSLVV